MSRKTRFERLLSPSQIGRVKTRNRIVKSATGLHFATSEGHISDAYLSWYETLAKGGVGLLIVGNAFVASSYQKPHFDEGRMMVYDDKFVPGLTNLAEAIHKHDCPTFLQLVHSYLGNRVSGPSAIASASPLSQGEHPIPKYGECRELTIAEIGDIVDNFVKAAERGQKAGFDGVEIHACHNDILNSFLSRAWNKRQDAYGCQDLRSRSRVLVETIQTIKGNLGGGFPVSVKINGAEYEIEKGTTPEESQGFAQILQEAGADAVNVTAYAHGDLAPLNHPHVSFYPEPSKPLPAGLAQLNKGVFAPLAAGIKKVVSIPVIAVGGLDPFIGESILREGKADLVAFGRALIADPNLPSKLASGRLEDIAPCTHCSACFAAISIPKPAVCRINAALGKEWEYEIKPAERKKRVMVVGGGPVGMEAARVVALRGHEVILYEREPKLGGATRLAALVKGFEIEDLLGLTRYFKTQIGKLGVRIRLSKEVNPALIEEINPDVVILATGGIPTIPEIAGINRSNVIKAENIYRMARFYLRFFGPKVLRWLTKIWMPFGKRVIIIGGSLQGCQLAEFLVKRGRKVTIVESSDQLMPEPLILSWNKLHLLDWFDRRGVRIFTGVRYEEITDKGLTITAGQGKRLTLEADTVVPALPLRPNTELFKAVERKVPEVYMIGDCREPRLMPEAVADGSRIGRAI